ncbi:MAG: hypothetical protein V5A72_03020 [Candidatus Nanohaloarchaea archaeon]
MTNETTLLVAVGLAILVIALAYGFSSSVGEEAKNSIIGGEEEDGLLDKDPTENPSEEDSSIEVTSSKLKTGEQLERN